MELVFWGRVLGKGDKDISGFKIVGVRVGVCLVCFGNSKEVVVVGGG